MESHMQQGHIYVLMSEGCVTGSEIGGNRVQIVWEGGGYAGGGSFKLQVYRASPGPNIK